MCRPPAMSADRPAASDGGPVVSHTRHLVVDHVRQSSAFWQVRHGAGDSATARRFTRPSPRDVDRLCSGVRWGEAVIPRPVVRGPMAVALPRSRSPIPFPPGRFGCATAGYVDRLQAATGSHHRPETAPGPAGDRPPLRAPAGDPTPIMQVEVRTWAKSRVSIETRELRLSSQECDFPGINIAISLCSKFVIGTSQTIPSYMYLRQYSGTTL